MFSNTRHHNGMLSPHSPDTAQNAGCSSRPQAMAAHNNNVSTSYGTAHGEPPQYGRAPFMLKLGDCINFQKPHGCTAEKNGGKCIYRHMKYDIGIGFCHEYDAWHRCRHGRNCRYLHASTRRTMCNEFQRNVCPKNADTCVYCHDPTRGRKGPYPRAQHPQQGYQQAQNMNYQHQPMAQGFNQQPMQQMGQFFGQPRFDNPMQAVMWQHMMLLQAQQQQQMSMPPMNQGNMQYPNGMQNQGPNQFNQFQQPYMEHSEARELTDGNHHVPLNTFRKFDDVLPSSKKSGSPATKKVEGKSPPMCIDYMNKGLGITVVPEKLRKAISASKVPQSVKALVPSTPKMVKGTAAATKESTIKLSPQIQELKAKVKVTEVRNKTAKELEDAKGSPEKSPAAAIPDAKLKDEATEAKDTEMLDANRQSNSSEKMSTSNGGAVNVEDIKTEKIKTEKVNNEVTKRKRDANQENTNAKDSSSEAKRIKIEPASSPVTVKTGSLPSVVVSKKELIVIPGLLMSRALSHSSEEEDQVDYETEDLDALFETAGY